MDGKVWTIGNVTISQIIEVDAGEVIQEIMPDANPASILGIPWLRPHFADENGKLKAVVQAFLVTTPTAAILVDTCVGNEKKRVELSAWNNLHTDFLHRLAALGRNRNDIDIILCTHLHFDHVGWNTMLEAGKWIPTFPRARHLFAKEEFEYWKGKPEKEIADDHAGFRDSILPVYEAGLVDLVQVDQSVVEGVSLIPTPGHTPAHVSVVIASGGEQAVITGDVLHHPCQIAHPEWATVGDTDRDRATRTRKGLIDRLVGSETLVIGSHFALPTAGKLVREGEEVRLLV